MASNLGKGPIEVGDVGSEVTVIGTAGEIYDKGSQLQKVLQVTIPDLSTASTQYIPCPYAGDIAKVYSAIDNAITVADATISFTIGGVAVTGGDITVAFTGSAAGDVDSATPTAANTVAAGDYISVATDGGSTTACETRVVICIE